MNFITSLQIFQDKGLSFDANFECGNLSSGQRVNQFEYDLFVRPDSIDQNLRLNFYFRIYDIQQYMINKPIMFNIVGIAKEKTSYANGQQILIRSDSRPKWSCIPKEQTFYYYSSRHTAYTKNQILTFVFVFDKIQNYYISFGYPYTYSVLDSYINKMQQQNFKYLVKTSLGKTYDGHELYLLKIGNQNAKHNIIITARCHPGEFPGSFACHGIIQYLLSQNIKAQKLRTKILFHIIPMINPDGVVKGNYRCNSKNIDLNRMFDDPDEKSSKECLLIRNYYRQLLIPQNQDIINSFSSYEMNWRLLSLAKQLEIERPIVSKHEVTYQKQCKNNKQYVDFVLDLHSHSNLVGGFIYSNPDCYALKQVQRQDCENVFPTLLSKKCGTFRVQGGDVIKQSQGKREGSIRRAFNQIGIDVMLDQAPHIYCIELSNSHGPDPRIEQANYNQLLNSDNSITNKSFDSAIEEVEQKQSRIRNSGCFNKFRKMNKNQNSNKNNEQKTNNQKQQAKIEQIQENDQKEQKFIKYTPDDYIQIGYKICETFYQIYDFNE